MDIKNGKKMVAPDGGWGWMVALATIISFFIIFPIAQSFGLLYKDIFKELAFTGTQNTIILNTNLAFSNLCGIINGPLIKHFGYRVVSFTGGVLLVLGLILTAHATKFEHFMITYGLITCKIIELYAFPKLQQPILFIILAIGFGMGLQSFPVALNSYFVKRRSKVNGYVSAIYGLGPILMPQLISYLLSEYDVKSIMIILSAIAGNVLVAAVLLQPVEWHMVEEKVEEIDNFENEEAEQFLDNEKPKRISLMLSDSTTSLHAVSRISVSEQTASICPEATSESSDEYYEKQQKKKTLAHRIFKAISKTFDLALLKDLTFVNIIFGLALDFLSEINFLILMPFIMADFNLATTQIATFMSTFAIADIIFRFLAPYLGDVLKYSQRVMLMITLVLLMMARSSLLIADNFVPLLFCAVTIGMVRGARLVYWTLVIPSYVPLDKLPAALGLQFTLNGILILMGGPLLGIIKDVTGTYRKCIYMLNFVTLITVTMWSIELLYKRNGTKINKSTEETCDI